MPGAWSGWSRGRPCSRLLAAVVSVVGDPDVAWASAVGRVRHRPSRPAVRPPARGGSGESLSSASPRPAPRRPRPRRRRLGGRGLSPVSSPCGCPSRAGRRTVRASRPGRRPQGGSPRGRARGAPRLSATTTGRPARRGDRVDGLRDVVAGVPACRPDPVRDGRGSALAHGPTGQVDAADPVRALERQRRSRADEVTLGPLAQPEPLLDQDQDRRPSGVWSAVEGTAAPRRRAAPGSIWPRAAGPPPAVAQRDRSGLVQQQHVDVTRGLDRAAGHREHVAPYQAVHPGDADRGRAGRRSWCGPCRPGG